MEESDSELDRTRILPIVSHESVRRSERASVPGLETRYFDRADWYSMLTGISLVYFVTLYLGECADFPAGALFVALALPFVLRRTRGTRD